MILSPEKSEAANPTVATDAQKRWWDRIPAIIVIAAAGSLMAVITAVMAIFEA
jgi:type IV secretory pathway TrbF-like protein